VADLADPHCLRFLDEISRAAPRTWLIVAHPIIEEEMRNLIRHHGGDALVATPIDVRDVARRVHAFQVPSRPYF
jgi:hypothetical protein